MFSIDQVWEAPYLQENLNYNLSVVDIKQQIIWEC